MAQWTLVRTHVLAMGFTSRLTRVSVARFTEAHSVVVVDFPIRRFHELSRLRLTRDNA